MCPQKMEATIDILHAYIIEKLDPNTIVPRLKANLTVGGSDRYFQKVSKCDGPTIPQDRNEELLNIIRGREEMWIPFIRACRECGYDTIADLLQAGLKGEVTPPPEPIYTGRNQKSKRKTNKPLAPVRQSWEIFGDAIDEIYADFLERVDPEHIIRLLKAKLTVGGSDRYFKKLCKPGRIRHQRNEDLLDIIRNREEMWEPFIDACRECDYESIAQHFEDALAKVDMASKSNRRRHRTSSNHESESFKPVWASSYSSGSKSLSLDTGNRSPRPCNSERSPCHSEVIYSRKDETELGSQSAQYPDEMKSSDEDVGHQYEGRTGGVNTGGESTDSGREEQDENGETCPSPETDLGDIEHQADITLNLNDSGKPSLLAKHVTGASEDCNQTGCDKAPKLEELPSSMTRSNTATSSSAAMGNIPKIVPSVFSCSSSTEGPCTKLEVLHDTDRNENLYQDSDVESSQLYGPGNNQQCQGRLDVDSATGSVYGPTLTESEDNRFPRGERQVLKLDEKQFEFEKYSSKCCLSEGSENPSVHERLAEEALNAQGTKQTSQSEGDASRGTPQVRAGEGPIVEEMVARETPVGDRSTLSLRFIIKCSIIAFADSIIHG